MKAKILKIKVNNNSYIAAEVEIYEDDGTLIFSGSRGFVCLDQTTQGVEDYLKASLKNIGNNTKAEKASKLKEEAKKLIGKEIDLDS